MEPYDVIAVGRAYTDVLAHVGFDFLEKWNIPVNGDREFLINEIKDIRASLPSPQMFAGGPSGNTASTLSALGGRTGFLGKVNKDEEGNFFLQDFVQRKIDFLCESYDTKIGLSPTCLVLETPDRGKSFAYTPGCADQFCKNDFPALAFILAKIFLIEAHLLTSSHAQNEIKGAIETAHSYKCQTAINLQGITSWQNRHQIVSYIGINSDIIIGNELEQAAFAQAASQHRPSHAMFVTTKGERGAEAYKGLKTHTVPAIEPTIFKGSTGAGDAFTAGFLLSLARGKDIPSCLKSGTRAATALLSEESGRPADKTPGAWAHLMNG